VFALHGLESFAYIADVLGATPDPFVAWRVGPIVIVITGVRVAHEDRVRIGFEEGGAEVDFQQLCRQVHTSVPVLLRPIEQQELHLS
jgi:hypothetical protein